MKSTFQTYSANKQRHKESNSKKKRLSVISPFTAKAQSHVYHCMQNSELLSSERIGDVLVCPCVLGRTRVTDSLTLVSSKKVLINSHGGSLTADPNEFKKTTHLPADKGKGSIISILVVQVNLFSI